MKRLKKINNTYLGMTRLSIIDIENAINQCQVNVVIIQ